MRNLFYTFTILFLLAASMPARAQLSIGIRAAANLSNVDAEYDGESDDTDKLFGIAVGLIAEIGLSEKFALQPELLYSQHGYQWSGSLEWPDTIGSWEGESRFSYIQIPILAKLKLGSERFGFHILAGPHVGLGVGKEEFEYRTFTTTNGNTQETFNQSSKNSWKDAGLKTFDLGITGGVGISIPAGPGSLNVDARYQLGLINFSDFSEDTIMNRNIQFGLSYLLPLAR